MEQVREARQRLHPLPSVHDLLIDPPHPEMQLYMIHDVLPFQQALLT